MVAFGQPHVSIVASCLAATVGYALFWKGIRKVSGRRARFLAGALWMVAVQLVQLRWMCTIQYQGWYIVFVYLGIAIWFGLQSGLFTIFLDRLENRRDLLAFAGLWTIFEWSRLFFLSGFPFNPAGLAMSWHVYPMQMATIGGVYLLSFWVIITNLFAYTGRYRAWVVSIFVPIVYGIFHLHFHLLHMEEQSSVATLVQPALLPDEKAFFTSRPDVFVSPLKQWEEMIDAIPSDPGMIVLPEALTPIAFSQPVYPLEVAMLLLKKKWGDDWPYVLPPLEMPYAEKQGERWLVTNAFWAQVIANHFGVEVIAGFDASENGISHNSAFHFMPENGKISRYDKRVLVPLAEYLPLKFLRGIVANYGITGHFTHGKEAKVFAGKTVSVCFEECYAHLMREGRKKGASVFVNVTNDGWFAPSKLPLAHLAHARLRSIENGAPLLHVSNTGASAAFDALGRRIGEVGEMYKKQSMRVQFSTYTFPTLYTFWGDFFVISGSLLAIMACLKNRARLPFSLTQTRMRGRS